MRLGNLTVLELASHKTESIDPGKGGRQGEPGGVTLSYGGLFSFFFFFVLRVTK